MQAWGELVCLCAYRLGFLQITDIWIFAPIVVLRISLLECVVVVAWFQTLVSLADTAWIFFIHCNSCAFSWRNCTRNLSWIWTEIPLNPLFIISRLSHEFFQHCIGDNRGFLIDVRGQNMMNVIPMRRRNYSFFIFFILLVFYDQLNSLSKLGGRLADIFATFCRVSSVLYCLSD